MSKVCLRIPQGGHTLKPKADSAAIFIEQLRTAVQLFVEYTDPEGIEAMLMFSIRRSGHNIDKIAKTCEMLGY